MLINILYQDYYYLFCYQYIPIFLSCKMRHYNYNLENVWKIEKFSFTNNLEILSRKIFVIVITVTITIRTIRANVTKQRKFVVNF